MTVPPLTGGRGVLAARPSRIEDSSKWQVEGDKVFMGADNTEEIETKFRQIQVLNRQLELMNRRLKQITLLLH